GSLGGRHAPARESRAPTGPGPGADFRHGPTDAAPRRRCISRGRPERDFEALVAVLDPGIVLRADGGAVKGMSRLVRGPQAVVAQAGAFSKIALSNQVVLVNGNIGVVTRLPDGRLFSVIGFTIAGGKVVEMDILADPARLSRLDLSAIEE